MECADAAHAFGGHIISDGGIEHPCDVVKALAAGADFVMAGSMFAGHYESPGQIHTDYANKTQYKSFYGMSSETALHMYNNGKKNYRTSEGKHAKIKVKGSLKDTVQDINGGLRSACTYVNVVNLEDLYENTQFIHVLHHHNTSLP
jgi:GMP reductase